MTDCCDCPTHRKVAGPRHRGWAGAILPTLACAFCPACLSLYGAALKTVGLGVLVTEQAHHVVLALALALTLGLAARLARHRRSATPLVIAAIGCALLTLGHTVERGPIEWLGLAVLVVGPALERRRWRRRLHAIHARAGAAAPGMLQVNRGS